MICCCTCMPAAAGLEEVDLAKKVRNALKDLQLDIE